MTGDCYKCKKRIGECSSLDQQKQQGKPYGCPWFEKDRDSYWESGWV